MLTNSDFWRGVKRKAKLSRRHRRKSSRRWMPAIRELCTRHGIEIKSIEHGYQFVRDEYVIVWSPSTNRVSVQYRLPGHGNTVPFKKVKPGKPRVIVALEEIIELIRLEGRPREEVL